MRAVKSDLPAEDIDAPQTICLKINTNWRQVLMDAIHRMEYSFSWADGTDVIRAEQNIYKFYHMLREANDDCAEDSCISYWPAESFIEYFPQNPYTQPDLVPDGYEHAPFYINNGVVFTDLFRVDANPFAWPAMIASGLPRIRVNVTGAAKVGLGLVSIVAGGIIFITKDDDILSSKWYELTSIGLIDVVAVMAAIPALLTGLLQGNPTPEEIYQDEIIEVQFDTPGAHTIDITFVPRVSPETIIGFGGGLKKVTICGGELPPVGGWDNPMQLRQNPENECELQWRSTATGEWLLAYDFSLCPPDCAAPPDVIYQYDSNFVLQISIDNGTTWTPAPQSDPRHSSTLFPPAPGADGDPKRCIAATGAALLFKEQIRDNLTDDMTRYTFDELLKDWVSTYVATNNPLQGLLTVIANQLFALSMLVLRPALTDAVFDTLKCILYCRMAPDVSFSVALWESVKSDISSQIIGVAGSFLNNLVNTLGSAGLTNIARAGRSTEGDCDECGCAAWIPVYVGEKGTFVSRVDSVLTASSIPWEEHGHTIFLQFSEGDVNRSICGKITVNTIPPETEFERAFSVYEACITGEGFVPGLTPYWEICASRWILVGDAPFTVEATAVSC